MIKIMHSKHNYIDKWTCIAMMNKNCSLIESDDGLLAFKKTKDGSKVAAFSLDFKFDPSMHKCVSWLYLDEEPDKRLFDSVYSLEEIVSDVDCSKMFWSGDKRPAQVLAGKDNVEWRGTVNKWRKAEKEGRFEVEPLSLSNLESTIGMIEAEFAVAPEISVSSLVAPDAQVLYVNTTNYDNIGKKCEWHYGDGNVERNCDELVEHIYAEPGCYEPFLVVMNRDLPECRDTAYLDIETPQCAPGYIYVDRASLLEVPNIFSPNGDGVNDYFQVHAQTLKKFSGKIVNRYGRVVYEWTDWENMESGWDGRLNGTTKATPGVYYYIIEAEGYDGMEYNPSGPLHLVR